MSRHRDGFLLSSWPDNPVIGTADGIRKERRKGEKSKCGQRGKKIPSGEAGRRERRSEEAVFGTSLFIPHALDCQGWG